MAAAQSTSGWTRRNIWASEACRGIYRAERRNRYLFGRLVEQQSCLWLVLRGIHINAILSIHDLQNTALRIGLEPLLVDQCHTPIYHIPIKSGVRSIILKSQYSSVPFSDQKISATGSLIVVAGCFVPVQFTIIEKETDDKCHFENEALCYCLKVFSIHRASKAEDDGTCEKADKMIGEI